jgi:hypothetical protein
MFDSADHRRPNFELLGAGLVVFGLLGVAFDIYRWIAFHRAPSLAVLYIPSMSLSFLRRAVVADGTRAPFPASWWYGLAVYYVVIGCVALTEWRFTSADRWFAGLLLFNLVAVCYRVMADRRKVATARSGAA